MVALEVLRIECGGESCKENRVLLEKVFTIHLRVVERMIADGVLGS